MDGGGEINPSILLLVVVLSAIFFISGLLHLLVRLLLKPAGGAAADDVDSVSALQGQLQQLFHLHDAGVDQSYIDTLPVFVYVDLVGAKDPFDCAVCLCEFQPQDKLRLLPRCSHAFHLPCIDTWLLSHSTCPLCRRAVVPLPSETPPAADVAAVDSPSLAGSPLVVPVKLGRFRAGGAGEGSSGAAGRNLDGRRCFSMGICDYVMDERLRLKVQIPTACSSMRVVAGGSQRAEGSSVSRIWRRMTAVSFRLPAAEEDKGGDRTADGVTDVEGGTVTRASETPSFARRTLQWIVSRGSRRIGDHS